MCSSDLADPAAPPDSLEWVVEAAASIGAHLLGRGAALRVVADTGDLMPPTRRGGLSAEDLLEQLAVLAPSRSAGLQVGLEALRRAADGPLICLLGTVEPDDVAALARARSGPGRDLAVLADPASWLDRGATRGHRPMNPAARSGVIARQEAAAQTLRAAGWQVAMAGADRPVEEVWAQLAVPAAGSTSWTTGVRA